jgi:hypothetical protein
MVLAIQMVMEKKGGNMSEDVLQKRLLTVASAFVANFGGAGWPHSDMQPYLVFRWTDETAELLRISFKEPKTEIERKIIDEIQKGSWPVLETKKLVGRIFFCSESYIDTATKRDKNWKIEEEVTLQEIMSMAESSLASGATSAEKPANEVLSQLLLTSPEAVKALKRALEQVRDKQFMSLDELRGLLPDSD